MRLQIKFCNRIFLLSFSSQAKLNKATYASVRKREADVFLNFASLGAITIEQYW